MNNASFSLGVFADWSLVLPEYVSTNLGWTLVHSVWQFAVVALFAFAIIKFARRRSASTRYLSLLACLLLMVAGPAVTWYLLPAEATAVSNSFEDAEKIESGIASGGAQGAPLLTSSVPFSSDPPPDIQPVHQTEAAPVDVKPATIRERLAVAIEPWLATIVGIWLAGVALFLTRPTWSLVTVYRLRFKGTSEAPSEVIHQLQQICRRMGVSRRIHVLTSTVVSSPVVIGCIRSLILLPVGFVAQVPTAQLEALLAHEVAHIRRHDFLVNILQTFIETLFFYHPAVWWLSSRIRMERENCCDDMVVAALNNRLDYGKALLAVEEFRAEHPPLSEMALSARGGSLLNRIRRLLDDRTGGRQPASNGPALLAIIATGIVSSILSISAWNEAVGSPAEDAPLGPDSAVAQLVDGGSVKILAINQLQTPEDGAWYANGERFEDPSELPNSKWSADRHPKNARQLFLQWDGCEDRGATLRVDGLLLYYGINAGLQRVCVAPSDDLKPLELRVGVTDVNWGPWQKVRLDGTRFDNPKIPRACRNVYRDIFPDHVDVQPQNLSFCWAGLTSMDERAEVELIAVQKDGTRDSSYGTSLWTSGNDNFGREIFKNPGQSITHFEYRLRPYRQWVTFKDVSLQATETTRVSVKVTDIPLPPAESADSDSSRFHGVVSTADGSAVKETRIRVHGHKGFHAETVSDEAGQFELTVPDEQFLSVVALSDDLSGIYTGSVRSKTSEERAGIDSPLNVRLLSTRLSEVSVVDNNDAPVMGATVVVQNGTTEIEVLKTNADGRVRVVVPEKGSEMIIAFKAGVGYDYFSADVRDENNYPVADPPRIGDQLQLKLDAATTLQIRAVDSKGEPIANARIRPWYVNRSDRDGNVNFGSDAFNLLTDVDGNAKFEWLPRKVDYGVTVWAYCDGYSEDRLDIQWAEFDTGSTYEAKLQKLISISGKVLKQNGTGAANARVQARGRGVGNNRGSAEATTDGLGNFSMTVAPDAAYVVSARYENEIGYTAPVTVLAGKTPDPIEIQLEAATVVRGKVTRGTPPTPVPDEWVSLKLDLGRVPKEIESLRPDGDNIYYSLSEVQGTRTDENGEFQFLVAKGEFVLSGPRQAKSHRFHVTDNSLTEYNFHVPRSEFVQFEGMVTDTNGNPVADAQIYGVYEGSTHARTSFTDTAGKNGRFSIQRESQPAIVRVLSPDKTLGALIEIDHDLSFANVELTPTFSAKGRLLTDDGRPWADATVQFGVHVYQGKRNNSPFMTSFGNKVQTSNDGVFRLDHLISNVEYHVSLERSKEGPWSHIGVVNTNGTKEFDLGNRPLARWEGPKPLDERVAASFAKTTPLIDRLETLKQECSRDYTRIALIVGTPNSAEAEWFYRILRGSRQEGEKIELDSDARSAIRNGMNDFRQLWVRTSELETIRQLIPDHELEADWNSGIILLDTDGSWLCAYEPRLDQKPSRAIDKLKMAVEHQQLPDLDAVTVMNQARSRAKRTGKKILLQETATWCGPCHLFSRFVEKHRDIFDAHFVWVKIDRQRMKNADRVLARIRLDGSRGIPWIAILSDQASVEMVDGQLATSSTMTSQQYKNLSVAMIGLREVKATRGDDDPLVQTINSRIEAIQDELPSDNFGYPSSPESADRFLKFLKATSPSMTQKDLDTLRQSLVPTAE